MYVNPHETPEQENISYYVGAFAAFMVFVIERIILSIDKINKWIIIIRFILGILIAFIGSLVIDQFLFRGDIEIERNKVKGERIDHLVASRSKDLKDQLIKLEEEKNALLLKSDSIQKEVMKKPYTREVIFKEESTENNGSEIKDQKQTGNTKKVQIILVPNPGIEILKEIKEKTALINSQIQERQMNMQQLRENVTKEVEKSFGLIDDLKLLWNMVFSSWSSVIVYFVFAFFFVIVELLIVLMKSENNRNGVEDEYHEIVREILNINRMNRTRDTLNKVLN
ncbi:hypothetical protein JCM31826_14920 [Thermaurantimonas aggregans]|uniref:DUF4407 domain-containing protein n=2 Tax=Thermaurantimonas aggregans TaxID=2173829 RepID=A0A401XLX6_9FLAO|nr:hypothetical protein JCM31826_14920 [Thermaurantimonas aggregans]